MGELWICNNAHECRYACIHKTAHKGSHRCLHPEYPECFGSKCIPHVLEVGMRVKVVKGATNPWAERIDFSEGVVHRLVAAGDLLDRCFIYGRAKDGMERRRYVLRKDLIPIPEAKPAKREWWEGLPDLVRVVSTIGIHSGYGIHVGDIAQDMQPRRNHMSWCHNPAWTCISTCNRKPVAPVERDNLEPFNPAKEASVKYESLKQISVKAIEEAGACKDELRKFAHLAMKDGRGYDDPLTAERAIKYAEQCEDGVEWLGRKGFVREAVAKVEKGQIYRLCEDQPPGPQEYIVGRTKKGLALFNPKTEVWWCEDPKSGDAFNGDRNLFTGPLKGHFEFVED